MGVNIAAYRPKMQSLMEAQECSEDLRHVLCMLLRLGVSSLSYYAMASCFARSRSMQTNFLSIRFHSLLVCCRFVLLEPMLVQVENVSSSVPSSCVTRKI
eukprot:1308335-Amphidinium_carterae.2